MNKERFERAYLYGTPFSAFVSVIMFVIISQFIRWWAALLTPITFIIGILLVYLFYSIIERYRQRIARSVK